MFIHPDGIVTVCCADSARTLPVGNVFKQNVKDIWLSDKYQNLRDLHAQGKYKEISICANCAFALY